MTETAYFTASNGITLEYEISKPKNYSEDKKYPLLFYLHHLYGDWDRPGYHTLLDMIYNQSGYEIIVLAPFADSKKKEFWFDYSIVEQNSMGKRIEDDTVFADKPTSAGLAAAVELLCEYRACPYIDSDRVLGMGFSMGAFGIWELAARFPSLLSAAAPVSGIGNRKEAVNAINLPIYAFHGDSDSIVSVEGTRDMVNAIRAAGGTKILYTEFKNSEHASHHFEAFKMALEWFLYSNL